MSLKKTTTTTKSEEKEQHKHGDVIFRAAKSPKNENFLGYATIFYHGLVLSDIAVTAYEKNGETSAMLTFPGKPRQKQDENGKWVNALDENGRQLYSNYYNPITKEAREELTQWVEDEINRAMSEE